MASIQKRKLKSGTAYIIRYYLNGRARRHYLPVGTTFKEAQVVRAQFAEKVAQHKAGIQLFENPLEPDRDSLTIRDFSEWIVNNKQGAPKTILTYKNQFRILIEAIGNMPLSFLPENLNTFEKYIQRYSPASRSICVRMLRACFSFGIKRGKIQTNPFLKITVPKSSNLPDILTIEEKDKICEKIENIEVKKAFVIARYAGLRRDEIVSLQWKDIYWKQNLINIPKAKTGENQKVPMLPDLKKFLFPLRSEGPVINAHPDTLTHKIHHAMKRAGIDKHGSLHILRHSLGAELRAQGIDIRDIQDLLRHTSISTTQIYTQLSKEKLLKKISDKTV
jgi:integrase/recombinase XerD